MKKFKLLFLVLFVLVIGCAIPEIKPVPEPKIPSVSPKAQIVYLTADFYYFFEGKDINPAELPFYVQLSIRSCKNNDPCLRIMVEQDGQMVVVITDLEMRRFYSYGYEKNGFIYVYYGESEIDSTGKKVIVFRLKSKQLAGDEI